MLPAASMRASGSQGCASVSAADRALTGPVVTWMIENDVAFLKAAEEAKKRAESAEAFAGIVDAKSPWTYRLLRSRANSIEGGTTEILKNIIAERVLGLPKLR